MNESIFGSNPNGEMTSGQCILPQEGPYAGEYLDGEWEAQFHNAMNQPQNYRDLYFQESGSDYDPHLGYALNLVERYYKELDAATTYAETEDVVAKYEIFLKENEEGVKKAIQFIKSKETIKFDEKIKKILEELDEYQTTDPAFLEEYDAIWSRILAIEGDTKLPSNISKRAYEVRRYFESRHPNLHNESLKKKSEIFKFNLKY